jgi:hypothetical protein
VGTHIRSERGWQGVVPDPFETVAKRRVAEGRDQPLQTVEILDDSTGLRATVWLRPPEVLVAGEDPCHLSVGGVEQFDSGPARRPVCRVAGPPETECRDLDTHCVRDDVVVMARLDESVPSFGFVVGVYRVGQVERLPVAAPVVALLGDVVEEFEQPRLAGLLVEPVDRHREVAPPIFRPRVQRPVVGRAVEKPTERRHRRGRTFVAGRPVMLIESLHRDVRRPRVERVVRRPVVRVDRSEIAVRILRVEKRLDPPLGLRLEGRVFEQMGERDQAVEVVRRLLVAPLVAASPRTVREVRVELV